MQHRHRDHSPESEHPSALPHVIDRRGFLRVRHVDHRPREDCHSRRGIHAHGPGVPRARRRKRLGGAPVVCRFVQHPVFGEEDGRIGRPAESGGAPHDRFEHWLRVCRRSRDGSQDLARRRLLLQRFGNLFMRLCQRMILLLQLREQPHVLDGNDRLVRKSLEEAGLLVGKRVYLGAPELNDADDRALAHEGSAQCRAKTYLRGEGARFGKLVRLSLKVGDLNGSLLEDGTPAQGAPYDWKQEVHGLGNRAMVGGRAQVISVDPEDRRVVSSAEASGALDHRVQDRLEIRRRPADHAQDLRGRRLLLERLREVGVARLQLLEETDVLDGDHRLGGEGLEKLDLHFGEGLHLVSRASDHSDRYSVRNDGNSHVRPICPRALQHF